MAQKTLEVLCEGYITFSKKKVEKKSDLIDTISNLCDILVLTNLTTDVQDLLAANLNKACVDSNR